MIIGLKGGKFWQEGKAVSVLFRRDMKVLIYNGADKEYAEKCMSDFNRIKKDVLNKLCRAAILYCYDSLNSWAEIDKRDDIEKAMKVQLTPDLPPEKILKCLVPKIMSVRHSEDDRIGYQIEFDCDWEPDKGMEIVMLGGELIYLGTFMDNSPWDTFPENDPQNYVNKL
ncbi:MAG: hypothetical protein J6I47_10590 [Ruminococcus sp.]|nr:hypothetical protein [Ruminococcus flavefaciens]MBP3747883.1 hypothetical protein [Ruminococcus sp.]